MSVLTKDGPVDYDIRVGDLVVVLKNTDLLLSAVYSNKICIVVEVFPQDANTVFNFELRILTACGNYVDVWLHEVRKVRANVPET